jgi:hypothetical protein
MNVLQQIAQTWNGLNLKQRWVVICMSPFIIPVFLVVTLLGVLFKFGTGKSGGVHLRDCPRDSTCTCYGETEPLSK